MAKSSYAMLNEPRDLEVSARLIEMVREVVERLEGRLTHDYLQREEHDKIFGAVVHLRPVLSAMEEAYQRASNL